MVTELLRFTIEADPVPASRPKVSRYGAYYPKSHTEYDKYLNEFLKVIPPVDHNGLIEVRMLFVMPRFKSSDWPTSRKDLDNLAKITLDSMTKAKVGDQPKFWLDDSLVASLLLAKRFVMGSELPHTKVVLATAENFDDYVDELTNRGLLYDDD